MSHLAASTLNVHTQDPEGSKPLPVPCKQGQPYECAHGAAAKHAQALILNMHPQHNDAGESKQAMLVVHCSTNAGVTCTLHAAIVKLE